MLAFKFTSIGSAKRSFHCKNIRDAHLFEHGKSSSLFFILAHRKSRLFEWKEITDFRHDVRKDSCCMGLVFQIISIHKNIFPSWMTVQVTVQSTFPFLWKNSHHSFYIKNNRVQNLWWIFPPPVQVLAT